MQSFQEYLQQGHAWLFIPAAIVLGALHGMEPGHSKTIMAAFIIAIRGTVTQAVLLGLSATLSHTAVIWVLAFIGLHYAGQLNVEELEPYFQAATGAIVTGLAGWMLLRVRAEQREAAAHGHHAGEQGPHGGTMIDTGHGGLEISVFETGVPPRFRLYFFDGGRQSRPVPPAEELTLETTRPDGAKQVFKFKTEGDYLEATEELPEPHEFAVKLTQAHGSHAHTYETQFVEAHHHHDPGGHEHHHDGMAAGEYQDAHERAHAQDLAARFANRQVTTGQIVLFGLTGGLLPCPSAFAILLVCLQVKEFTLGFAIVLAFSLGLALTLVSVGALAALSVREASKRFKGFGEFARKAPYVSSTVMLLIGLAVLVQGLRQLAK
ncbi:MAG: nickel/cobalt efflux transporter RcnA [Verrucomicrobia bacterium]|nr:nickel/cobalt efflux transporter RcnA [Verrucomicrobiota bacterium]NBU08917.1 nickel/cobalt efflux transporter RcnA [Pseudomonadota bacterium]NDD38712.1 nickel/cobalt efflux transporter RcnA [Verrucomicrobiota bacterium]NDF00003.1 nickel/cobalt efflux transporter RcnA [Verrucomicrobiota bacterium]